MSRKAFLVKVELDVQAVTCPGVWLCSNGKIALQIYMLDSRVQTNSHKPNFPMTCNETFVFYKTFYSKHHLRELEKELHEQWIYIELVQWQSCEIGCVLATFKTTLDELLYPSTYKGSVAGVDLDLLMEPSKTFPGMIAPKVEVSTRTTIEETLCVCMDTNPTTVVVNPKVISSSAEKPKRNIPRKVCHSIEYSRKRPLKSTKPRPVFRYRRAEDDLILRKPTLDTDNDICRCRESRSLDRKKKPSCRPRKPSPNNKGAELVQPIRPCSCGGGHREKLCSVCAKYQGYFSQEQAEENSDAKPPRTKLFNKHYGHLEKCYSRPMAFATSDGKSDSSSGDSRSEGFQVCACMMEKKPSLAERLHAKLTKTLSSIPRSLEWPCYEDFDDEDDECDCCECPHPSRAELYRDLQKFYGDLYERAVSQSCIPDCAGRNK